MPTVWMSPENICFSTVPQVSHDKNIQFHYYRHMN